MKEFALIFRLKDIADFKPSSEQMQERMNWLAGIASQNKLVDVKKAIFHYGQAINPKKKTDIEKSN